ncbi:beta-1,6-N-acetylglucosaminyltransferase [Chachezhania antarctica]|uniref:DUF5927 domain-containing protein n=1 Tax=Chachezhania antarctica TaxID=2340860 RepID=UPI000EAFE2F7|nr:beta-1,6-N-acetylglucosaminyltransferase [Chachezhania antarctica]|tara:strand:- start:5448 stop:7145 length:1698 start_codon:yes stop_codon:yes gene_type:complete
MTVGIIMLVHTDFERAEQVARHWTKSGCPVVIHVDRKSPTAEYDRFSMALNADPLVRFSKRHRCEWGKWSIVQATISACEVMLAEFPQADHVFLASGSCIPLRPVEELVQYLHDRPDTDFIESATTADVPWIVGGLSDERFTMFFPFSWKRQRYLFDKSVELQRKIGIRRRIPQGLVPHMGSQWWCLTRRTLDEILSDPNRRRHVAYFREVWIPDESYFQSLARIHSRKVESRSLTLSKFDFQGKPHVFYDDHLQLLRRSDCFVARKIWPRATRLYQTFLGSGGVAAGRSEPNPGKIDRIFARAVDRRLRGRAGLQMQSRFPRQGFEHGITAKPYSMFQGFTEIFEDFEDWLTRTTGARVHGHLFAPDRAHFADGQTVINGALSDSATLRDYDACQFLTSLIWNTRGERQCFQYGPADTQDINFMMVRDPNAQISIISGAWAVPLFRSGSSFAQLRQTAARLQKIEAQQLEIMRASWANARVRIWSMAEFIESPMEPLQTITDEFGQSGQRHLSEAPRLRDLSGFGQFLQHLKNEGMHPYLMGDFPVEQSDHMQVPPVRKPYLVR